MEVSMPTRAIIPKAMIRMVSTVRSKWLLIETSDTLIFSVIKIFKGNANFDVTKVTKHYKDKEKPVKLMSRFKNKIK